MQAYIAIDCPQHQHKGQHQNFAFEGTATLPTVGAFDTGACTGSSTDLHLRATAQTFTISCCLRSRPSGRLEVFLGAVFLPGIFLMQ